MLERTNSKTLSLLGSLLAIGAIHSPANCQSWSNNYFFGGLDNTVNKVVTGSGNTIYMGGAFTHANGLVVNRVARFTTAWSALGSGGPTTDVTAMAIRASGNLITGELNGAVREWNGSTWSNLGATFNARVNHLAVLANGDVVAGGPFTAPVVGVARFSGSWTALGAGLSGVASVGGIGQSPSGDIVVGGSFTPTGLSPTSLAVFASGAWTSFASSALPAGVVDAMQVTKNGDVVAAYRAPGNLISLRRGSASGAGWTSIASTLNGAVNSVLELPDGNIMVGGSFTSIGAVTCPSIARFDGTTWTAQANPVNGAVNALAISDERRIVAAGAFTIMDGSVANRASVRFAVQSGSVTQIFPSCIGPNGLVRSLSSNDVPYIGTTFTSQASGYETNAAVALEIRSLSQISPLPLNNLLAEGNPSCFLLISPDLLLTVPTPMANGQVQVSFDVPVNAGFLGATMFQQVGAIEPTATSFSVTAGHALAITFGRL